MRRGRRRKWGRRRCDGLRSTSGSILKDATAEEGDTPLQVKLAGLVRQIMFVGVAAALLLILLGLFPKLAAVISVMPRPVLGGATVIMFAMVAVAGLQLTSNGHA